MRQRFRLMAYYFIFWTLFFVIGRVVFLFFHIDDAKKLTLETVYLIFRHGLKQDLSVAGVVSFIPFLMTGFSNYVRKSKLERWIFSYTFTLMVLFSILMIIDLQVFNVWNYRLDITPFKYLTSIRSAFGSVRAAPFWPLFFSFFVMIAVSIFFVYRKITSYIDDWQHVENFPRFVPSALALTALLIIPMRGGITKDLINQKDAYFSKQNFVNLVALNPIWNLVNSIFHKTTTKPNPYLYLPSNVIDAVFKFMYNGTKQPSGLFKDKKVLVYFNAKPDSSQKANWYTSALDQKGLLAEALSGHYASPNLGIDLNRKDINNLQNTANLKVALFSQSTANADIVFTDQPADEKAFQVIFKISKIDSHRLSVGLTIDQKNINLPVASLSDFPATVLSGFGLSTDRFKLSKDVFDITQRKWAYYTDEKGFGLIQDTGAYYFDTEKNSKKILAGQIEKRDVNRGKAITQKIYQDFVDQELNK